MLSDPTDKDRETARRIADGHTYAARCKNEIISALAQAREEGRRERDDDLKRLRRELLAMTNTAEHWQDAALPPGCIAVPRKTYDELLAACNAANEELCRASFPGPRDKRGINGAIDKLRASIAKAESR